eukprot:TRINITY_DN7411_c0_g1_i1.p1 TRINITY_DN7411_c0_g1~~TRINITY_DN7411_c0_g1_i1.p1  ORF type:complete len:164 (+),score=42.08 TRINITY_DN7411_c0_g1_i1:787-1278(+)
MVGGDKCEVIVKYRKLTVGVLVGLHEGMYHADFKHAIYQRLKEQREVDFAGVPIEVRRMRLFVEENGSAIEEDWIGFRQKMYAVIEEVRLLLSKRILLSSLAERIWASSFARSLVHLPIGGLLCGPDHPPVLSQQPLCKNYNCVHQHTQRCPTHCSTKLCRCS